MGEEVLRKVQLAGRCVGRVCRGPQPTTPTFSYTCKTRHFISRGHIAPTTSAGYLLWPVLFVWLYLATTGTATSTITATVLWFLCPAPALTTRSRIFSCGTFLRWLWTFWWCYCCWADHFHSCRLYSHLLASPRWFYTHCLTCSYRNPSSFTSHLSVYILFTHYPPSSANRHPPALTLPPFSHTTFIIHHIILSTLDSIPIHHLLYPPHYTCTIQHHPHPPPSSAATQFHIILLPTRNSNLTQKLSYFLSFTASPQSTHHTAIPHALHNLTYPVSSTILL